MLAPIGSVIDTTEAYGVLLTDPFIVFLLSTVFGGFRTKQWASAEDCSFEHFTGLSPIPSTSDCNGMLPIPSLLGLETPRG